MNIPYNRDTELKAAHTRIRELEAAMRPLVEAWRGYRDDSTLNQQDAYYRLAKGMWNQWQMIEHLLGYDSAKEGK